MTAYNKVNDTVIKELKTIVGDKYVWTDPDRLEAYARDGLTGVEYAKAPEAVVRPRTVEEICGIVKLANRARIPVVPRGAGTGLVGGAVAFGGGIVVSTERMNEILEVDVENMVLVSEPGVITEVVQKAAYDQGFMYAGDPGSSDSSFIGGNVATNAGGMNAVKYGTTRQQVLGLEIVTPEGEVVTLGGKLRKNSTGYCLSQLIAGSEGTLGIITKVFLRLVPRPKHDMVLLAVFPSAKLAASIVPKIMQSGITPVGIEFMDNKGVRCVGAHLKQTIPHSDQGYYIIIALEGDSEDVLEEQALVINELCANNGVIEVLVPEPAKIWKIRKSFNEANRTRGGVVSGEDIVVPIANIPDVIAKVAEIGARYNVAIHCCAHAGDGNIHPEVLKEGMSQEEWDVKHLEIQEEICRFASELGGRLSGEHGIGYKRVQLMEKLSSPVEIKMMKAIKQALDPNNIMNPGKVLEVA